MTSIANSLVFGDLHGRVLLAFANSIADQVSSSRIMHSK